MFYNKIIKTKEQTRSEIEAINSYKPITAAIHEIKGEIKTEIFKIIDFIELWLFEKQRTHHVIAKSSLVQCEASFLFIYFC